MLTRYVLLSHADIALIITSVQRARTAYVTTERGPDTEEEIDAEFTDDGDFEDSDF